MSELLNTEEIKAEVHALKDELLEIGNPNDEPRPAAVWNERHGIDHDALSDVLMEAAFALAMARGVNPAEVATAMSMGIQIGIKLKLAAQAKMAESVTADLDELPEVES